MFCLKSYYSLFTNLQIEQTTEGHSKSEMAYFMLDMLFLLGNPRQSETLRDDPTEDGMFNVGETIPPLERVKPKLRQDLKETRVRLDRTS